MIPASTQAELERALVGSVLMWPEQTADVELEPHVLTGPKWRAAWQTILELRASGDAIDPIIVASRIPGNVVGPGELIAGAESPHAARTIAGELRTAAVTRAVELAASEVLSEIKSGLRGAEALDVALQKLAAITAEQPTQTLTVGELVKARFLELGEIAAAKARGEDITTGVPTGIDSLDKMLGGLQRGVCTVVAGRPGMGKSAFGMSVVDGATSAGFGAHVFSLEDTRAAYSDRLLSRCSGVPVQALRACELTRGQLEDLDRRGRSLVHRDWLVDDRSGITAEEIVRSVRRCAKSNNTAIVVVDYIQLVRPSRGEKEHEQLGHSMQVLADAAKLDNMAYLVLSQLNRDCERRPDKRPTLGDLKSSGALEEKAKAVVMLYRPSEYEPNAPKDLIELLVRKNNHGQTGVVLANWHAETTRIC